VTSTSTDVANHLAMIVVMVPVVMVVMAWRCVSAIVVVVISATIVCAVVVSAVLKLSRHCPTVMFRERIAGINTRPAIVARAGVIGAGLWCECSSRGREHDSKHKYFHFKTSTI
jgi:hypothetical protein